MRSESGPSRAWIAVAAVAAALLANYWVLEGALADRTDPAAWVSDLGARSEAGAWRFNLLDSLAGLALCGFALAIRSPLGGGGSALRLGTWALFAAGVLGAVDGLFPLSCAQALEAGCELAWDWRDVVHAIETTLAVGLTAVALVGIGVELRAESPMRRLGTLALALAVAWMLLTAVSVASYVSADLDEVKGVLQRAGQVVFAAWIAVVAAAAARRTGEGAKPSPGLGRIDGDGAGSKPTRMQ